MFLRADDKSNMHLSKYTELCLFSTEVLFPVRDQEGVVTQEGKVVVTFHSPTPNDFSPAHCEDSCIEIPLEPDVVALGLAKEQIMMYSSPTTGYDMGERYNQWFSERLGYEVLLIYIGENRREVLGGMPPKAAARIMREREREAQVNEQPEEQKAGLVASIKSMMPAISIFSRNSTASEEEECPGVDEGFGFAETAPYLVVSTKSWENVSRRLPEGENMDITKFRGNIILEGAEKEFEEDFWGELEVHEALPSVGIEAPVPGEGEPSSTQIPNSTATRQRKVKLVLTQNCARCNALNVDYATGKVGGGDAGKILKKLQSDRRVDDGSRYSPVFGRYGFLDRLSNGHSTVSLRVGDEVSVGKWNSIRTKWCKFSKT